MKKRRIVEDETVVSVRMSVTDRDLIKLIARTEGVTISEYMRHAAITLARVRHERSAAA